MTKASIDPRMSAAIKDYLDEAAKNDTALDAVYDAGKIDDCCGYVTDKVREAYIKQNGRKDGGTFVSPEDIFKLARDFFIDGHAAAEKADTGKDEEECDEPVAEQEKPAEKPADAPRKKRLGELEQLDLFAGLGV